MSIFIPQFLESGAIMSLSQDKLLIGWGNAQRMTNDQLDPCKPSFYFSDFFFTDSLPWVQYSNWIEIGCENFEKLLQPHSHLTTCDWIIHKPEQFREAFQELQKSLHAGHLQKAVPYLFAISFSLMTKQRLQNSLKMTLASLKKKVGYLYGFWNGPDGVLGLTPEMLFSHSQHDPHKLQTMAIAGTCHSSHSQERFLKNEKERHEHELVVQGICESLRSMGLVRVGSTQLLKLPRLTHLMTPIEAELSTPFHFDTLASCLHPSPALGALPVEEGKKWLKEYQKHTPRRYYGAPIGFRNPQMGLSNCLVGIRNVQWDSSGMYIGAGCGVVKQSTFEKEWQEIQYKIRTIRDQLNL
jgi:isochorismate synthase EntC